MADRNASHVSDACRESAHQGDNGLRPSDVVAIYRDMDSHSSGPQGRSRQNAEPASSTIDCGTASDLYGKNQCDLNDRARGDLRAVERHLQSGDFAQADYYLKAANHDLQLENPNGGVDLINRAQGDIRAAQLYGKEGNAALAAYYTNAANRDLLALQGKPPQSIDGSGHHNSSPSPGEKNSQPPAQSKNPRVESSDDQQTRVDEPSADGKTMFGAYVNVGDAHANSVEDAEARFEKSIGRKLAIGHWYTNFGQLPDRQTMLDLNKNGTEPMISLAGGNSNEVASGKDDDYLHKLAQELKSVPGDVMLRYGWEMDGRWNQNWVQNPQQYVKAWQHIHDVFQSEGVDNVKFVWCPDAQAFDKGASLANRYYPGDNYVDYVGADGYSGIRYAAAPNQYKELPYQSPQAIFQSGVNFANSHGKPFIIGETGVQTDLGASTDARYVQEMRDWIKTQPDVKALVWFQSAPKREHNDWLVDSSQEELNAMKELANDPYFAG